MAPTEKTFNVDVDRCASRSRARDLDLASSSIDFATPTVAVDRSIIVMMDDASSRGAAGTRARDDGGHARA